VDDGTNNPVFTYPHTAMAGWLCQSLSNQQSQSCYTNYNWMTCPNESSAQGQSYFRNFTQANSPAIYSLNPVESCNGPEGIAAGTVISTGQGGLIAIQQNMAGGSGVTAQCSHSY
jgi:hypothetical protein